MTPRTQRTHGFKKPFGKPHQQHKGQHPERDWRRSVSENEPKPQQDEKGRFISGNIGGGRPKGARSKLGEAFVQALHDDFNQHGSETIARVREERPQDYMKVVASLLPKEFKIETTSDLTDEQLDARIRQLASVLEIGISDASGGSQAPQGSKATH